MTVPFWPSVWWPQLAGSRQPVPVTAVPLPPSPLPKLAGAGKLTAAVVPRYPGPVPVGVWFSGDISSSAVATKYPQALVNANFWSYSYLAATALENAVYFGSEGIFAPGVLGGHFVKAKFTGIGGLSGVPAPQRLSNFASEGIFSCHVTHGFAFYFDFQFT
jgi:hypothetical protein